MDGLAPLFQTAIVNIDHPSAFDKAGEPALVIATAIALVAVSIVAVVAAITAASYATTPVGRMSRWLFILPLATIFVCLANAAIFNLYGPPDSRGVMAQLFVNTATNLAVYVMLFVGLQLSQGEAK